MSAVPCLDSTRSPRHNNSEQWSTLASRLQASKQASKQASNLADGSLRSALRIAAAVVLVSGVVGCGNSNTGAMDGGEGGVVGDVVEYGVRGRPQNSRYCAQLAASAAPVATTSHRVTLCAPDADPATVCPGDLPRCVPINRFSTDLDAYVRDNRVPQVCTSSDRTYVEGCRSEAPGGCGDGTFCARVHYRFSDPSDTEICVPYPCNL